MLILIFLIILIISFILAFISMNDFEYQPPKLIFFQKKMGRIVFFKKGIRHYSSSSFSSSLMGKSKEK